MWYSAETEKHESQNHSNKMSCQRLQSELGCAGDWDPACANTFLNFDAGDDVWQKSFNVPVGNWQFKAALNGGWDENYGANAQPNGSNIGLNLAAGTAVKFFYDHKSHWVTDNVNHVIAVAPGSFQSELGCAGDWDPGCLRSWLHPARRSLGDPQRTSQALQRVDRQFLERNLLIT